MALLLTVLLLYILPAYIVWKRMRWVYTHIHKQANPTVYDVLEVLLPVINFVAALIYLFDGLERKSFRKFFGIGDRR